MVNLITYELIYETLRKEKQFQELQKLDPNFFKNAATYLIEKYKTLESQKAKDSIFAQTETKNTEKQIENTKKILKELYEKRENKITQLAILNSRTKNKTMPNLLAEEESFYNELLKILDVYRKEALESLMPILNEVPSNEKPKEIKSLKEELKSVTFIKDVPKFIGDDLKVYGPFQPKDNAVIPLKTANLLIERKRAIESENPQNQEQVL